MDLNKKIEVAIPRTGIIAYGNGPHDKVILQGVCQACGCLSWYNTNCELQDFVTACGELISCEEVHFLDVFLGLLDVDEISFLDCNLCYDCFNAFCHKGEKESLN